MYFPKDMTFQYFFFDTYPGYFLEALPIAIIVAMIWYALRYHRDKHTLPLQKFWACTFVCYMTGIVCLAVLLKVMQIMWYTLLYHRTSGIRIFWFDGTYNFIPDFWTHINGETIGNFLMFLPFGILYPLSHSKHTFKKTILAGFICIVVIEILQPIFDRAFDINDIILNTLGVIASTAAFFFVRDFFQKDKPA